MAALQRPLRSSLEAAHAAQQAERMAQPVPLYHAALCERRRAACGDDQITELALRIVAALLDANPPRASVIGQAQQPAELSF